MRSRYSEDFGELGRAVSIQETEYKDRCRGSGFGYRDDEWRNMKC
jgi:hypothetical protein